MNPLKNLFSKVFESTPGADAKSDASKENGAFEWNPEEETVAPTSAQGVSWKRGGAADESAARTAVEKTADVVATAHNLPTMSFDKTTSAPASESQPAIIRPMWNEPAVPVTVAIEPVTPAPVAPTVPAPPLPTPVVAPQREEPVLPAAQAIAQGWARPGVQEPAAMTVAPQAGVAHPVLPLSDFEDIYRKAGIKSPVHGYGVERVYRLLTSRRLAGLDRSIRRSALLTALDAAGVPPSDVSQDAVLRRKALAAYEAEKALELQSLRSRNESRAEALQDTVETFTRQKQSQIERLAQGSTAAVRAQSDLEIRKRMEQDRLYRSLAYFVEPLPTVSAYQPPPARAERAIDVQEIRPSAAEPTNFASPAFTSMTRVETSRTEAIDITPTIPAGMIGATTTEFETPPVRTVEQPIVVTPPETASDDLGADTRPMPSSGLEMALRAAAEEAKTAGWGKAAIVEDSAGDAVESLRKLREAQKSEPES